MRLLTSVLETQSPSFTQVYSDRLWIKTKLVTHVNGNVSADLTTHSNSTKRLLITIAPEYCILQFGEQAPRVLFISMP